MNQIKNGRVDVRASEALLIAAAIGKTVEELFALNLEVCGVDTVLGVTAATGRLGRRVRDRTG